MGEVVATEGGGLMACDVCESWGRPDVCTGDVGVASSTLGAMSVSWCRAALEAGVDVRWGFEAIVGVSDPGTAAAWRAGLAGWAQEMVLRALALYGVSEDEFVAGLVESGVREAEMMAKLAALPVDVAPLAPGEPF